MAHDGLLRLAPSTVRTPQPICAAARHRPAPLTPAWLHQVALVSGWSMHACRLEIFCVVSRDGKTLTETTADCGNLNQSECKKPTA